MPAVFKVEVDTGSSMWHAGHWHHSAIRSCFVALPSVPRSFPDAGPFILKNTYAGNKRRHVFRKLSFLLGHRSAAYLDAARRVCIAIGLNLQLHPGITDCKSVRIGVVDVDALAEPSSSNDKSKRAAVPKSTDNSNTSTSTARGDEQQLTQPGVAMALGGAKAT